MTEFIEMFVCHSFEMNTWKTFMLKNNLKREETSECKIQTFCVLNLKIKMKVEPDLEN